MISVIEHLAKKNKSKIAIGCSSDERQSSITISGAIQAKKRDFVEPIVIGTNLQPNSNIETRNSKNPTTELKRLLLAGEVDGIVRGSLVARNFVHVIKENEKGLKNITTAKLALMENSVNGKSFFISPVGIDEGNTVAEKIFILNKCIKYLNILNTSPKVEVLAAGKLPDDLGLHPLSDQTIKDAELIVSKFKDQIEIFSDGILIENGIEHDANIVLCSNGIMGNLIHRSLVNLTSEWKTYGAIIATNNPIFDGKVILDTSQFATMHEYRRSLIFASALSK